MSLSVKKRMNIWRIKSYQAASFRDKRLTEEHLADEFGVSRTPVREALHKLELEGLVKQPLETRGFLCSSGLRLRRWRKYSTWGRLWRALPCGWFAATSRKKIFSALIAFIEAGEVALRAEDKEKVFDANTNFHDILHSLISKSRPRLLSLMQDMRKYILRYREKIPFTISRVLSAASTTDIKKIILGPYD